MEQYVSARVKGEWQIGQFIAIYPFDIDTHNISKLKSIDKR